ncbi:MAG: hypothetical protein ABSB13_09145 [Candidatus Binatus sp.]|jgi:hypothetical protein|uniref:hypothetical protein n=1 Tax=Candidatus Binatus sp. TaxID=2811406 RepID=UPI003D0A163D
MSSAEFEGDLNKESGESTESGQDNDSLASKLSKELSNWRRNRSSSQPRHSDGPSQNFQSEPARTIKVRGHETLVVRKPKLAAKPPTNTNHTPNNQ